MRRELDGHAKRRADAALDQAESTEGIGADDPGLATDTTSADVINNIMDPLVKLGADLEPVPNLAESWDMSADGKTVTFTSAATGSGQTGIR